MTYDQKAHKGIVISQSSVELKKCHIKIIQCNPELTSTITTQNS